ncbi:PKD domain-containing protein [Filimonas effusa]|uniref:PKD domain-containing protein n=1 Tax=Filimonas effusa TaxID=2508721 RepID=A0A4Q1DAU8_9BACT|nr:PKD domain-containing protein [Filimonas effusa]RXK86537.1 PKD domain-containing protein [Filimonas effusa]
MLIRKSVVLTIMIVVLVSAQLYAQNFTNRGKEFWVGYGHNWYFASRSISNYNTQEMVLYLSAEQEAHVQVSVPGTNWIKDYVVPANTAISTAPMPKGAAIDAGADARLTDEGLFRKNIHITSDVPVSVFAHVYGNTSSGATMLLPVDVYGYTYYAAGAVQDYDATCYSWVYVVANENNTLVRITPSRITKGGRQRNVAFDITLNKGECYNLMSDQDLSGSKIQSVAGRDGICHPVGVFTGSSRTSICALDLGGGGRSGGDFLMQQGFPTSAWGKNFLTAVTNSTDGFTAPNMNRFRVYLKDLANTTVYRNGAPLTGIQNGRYYEFMSATADKITATGPVMVCQILHSGLGCNATGDGDPELLYLTPLEQAIKQVNFYSTGKETILHNYITIVVPDEGMSSLKIDGQQVFDHTYAHTNQPGYKVVVKELPLTAMQHRVECDTTFTGITYGLGQAESYGYNIGCNVNNLAAFAEIKPEDKDVTFSYVCTKTPFLLSVKTIYEASAITMHFSRVSGITPAQDVTINNPVPVATSVINGRTYYTYDLKEKYLFTTAGDRDLPISITAPSIDNCSNSEIVTVKIPVQQGPSFDFTFNAGCLPEKVLFTPIPMSTGAKPAGWEFGDGTTSTEEKPEKKYTSDGKYDVTLRIVRESDGCRGDTTKQIIIKPLPLAGFELPQTVCMPEGKTSFKNTTVAGGTVTYQWRFGDGTGATDKDPIHHYAAPGNYTIKLTAEAEGCKDSATMTLAKEVFVTTPEPAFSIAAGKFCIDDLVTFTDKTAEDPARPLSRNWDLGNGKTAAEQAPSTYYTRGGTYPVTLNISAGGCTPRAITHNVQVNEPPKTDAGADLLVSPGEQAYIRATVSDAGAELLWSPSLYLSASNVLSPIVTPATDQKYYLKATNKDGCSSYDSVVVKVYSEIKVPNIFTPNGDGIHDAWEIKGLQNYSNATIDIFNRWGQCVHRITGGYRNAWYGTDAQGALLPAGIYYYILQPGVSGAGKITGSVTIVR